MSTQDAAAAACRGAADARYPFHYHRWLAFQAGARAVRDAQRNQIAPPVYIGHPKRQQAWHEGWKWQQRRTGGLTLTAEALVDALEHLSDYLPPGHSSPVPPHQWFEALASALREQIKEAS